MIINHNLPGSNAIRQMNINSSNASKSMQKLSSGLRINSAADDAAGLAISEKMRSQIRGLDQASANAQDGISMIQTAEGALNETTSILQRMRELSVQSANDTNVSSDRTEIQRELSQLTSEINRIGNTTEFNTQSILNGSISKTAKGMTGYSASTTGISTVLVDKGTALDNGSYNIVVGNTTVKSGTASSTLGGGISNIEVAENSTLAASSAAYSIEIASTTVAAKGTQTLDDGLTNVTVAGNSTLTDGTYKINVTRVDAATLTATNTANLTGATLTATGSTGLEAGTYTVETTFEASGLTAASGDTLLTGVTITNQASFAAFGKGGDDIQLRSVAAGKVALFSKDGTTQLSATITLDNGVQSYKVYGTGAGSTTYTGITINTADNAATLANGAGTDKTTFDIDTNMTVKTAAGTQLATTTIAAGTAAGSVTLDVGEADLTIDYGGTTASATTGLLHAASMTIGSTDITVTNTLSAQLKTNGGTNIGSAATFTAGSNVNLSSGIAFTSSASLDNYDALAAAETSTFTVTTADGFTATLKNGAGVQVGDQLFVQDNTQGYTFDAGVSFDAGTLAAGSGTFTVSETAAFSATLQDSLGATIATKTLQADKTADFGSGIKAAVGDTIATGTASFTVNSSTDGTLSMQVGANMGQKFGIDVEDMRAHAIGVSGSSNTETITDKDGNAIEGAAFVATSNVTNGTDNNDVEYSLDISTATKASAAIKVIDKAIQTVSAERSKLGAYQNRLEHTINNLGTSSENLTSAESRIRDVDMAKEMATFSKNNILAQAAQAMLAQANQQPQQVLQLLR